MTANEPRPTTNTVGLPLPGDVHPLTLGTESGSAAGPFPNRDERSLPPWASASWGGTHQGPQRLWLSEMITGRRAVIAGGRSTSHEAVPPIWSVTRHRYSSSAARIEFRGSTRFRGRREENHLRENTRHGHYRAVEPESAYPAGAAQTDRNAPGRGAA